MNPAPAKDLSDYQGIPVLSQMLGYITSNSMMIDPQHMPDYIGHITNQYLPEITNELEEIGESELARDVEKLSRYGPGILLAFREKGLLNKLLPSEDHVKAVKLLHPELSDKAARVASFAYMGYVINKIHNPYGIHDIDMKHILTGMTNFRGGKARPSMLELITQEDADAFRREYTPEKVDPMMLREQRLPEAMPRRQLHELNK
jgi:hypothetical protein